MARGQGGSAEDILYGRLLGRTCRPATRTRQDQGIDPITGMRIPEWWPHRQPMDLKRLELSNFFVNVCGYTGSDFVMISAEDIPDGWREASCYGEDAMINTMASTSLAEAFVNRVEACLIPELDPDAFRDLEITKVADTDIKITVDGLKDWQGREFAEWVHSEQLAAVEHFAPREGHWKFFHSPYDAEAYGLVYLADDDPLPMLGAVEFCDYRDYS